MSLPVAVPPSPPEPMMTAEEVAAFLKISVSMVYKLRRTGALRAKPVGALYRFHPDVVRAFASGEPAVVHPFPHRRP